jgi:TonB family protein
MRLFLLSVVLVLGLAAQEPYKIGGDVSAPVPKVKVEPGYSSEAKAARVEGTCVLSIMIDAEGTPRDISVVKVMFKDKDTGKPVEGDCGLSQEAVKALEQWRFEPGRKEGKAVAVKANVEMNFRLK